VTQPGDRERAGAPALVLFGIMAGHALLETARDALFLARLGADRLAWAYLGIAAAALATVWLVRRTTGARDPRAILGGLLAGAAGGTAVLAATVAIAPSIVFVLYVWTGVAAALVVPAFWTVVDRTLRVGDAKRVFAGIAAGGSLGALAGSAIATALTRILPPAHLVTVAAGVFAACGAAALRRLPRTPDHAAPVRRPRIAPAASPRRTARYVKLLVVLGLVSTVALTLGDLVFKRIVNERVPGADLATALGAINTGINITALVIQLVVTPRLLGRFGVGGALTVLPVIVTVTALGFVVTGAALAVFALKLGDAGLRYSLHRVASEILFLPLAAGVRDTTKPAIDVIGQRGGQALAALVALAATSLGATTWVLGVLTAAAGAGWLVAVCISRAAYIEQFRDTLAAGDIQRDVRVPPLDADSVALLTEALASPDEAEALAALDLLARRGGHVPALVLYHPSHAVVRRALALVGKTARSDVQRALGHLVANADPQIRAAALAAASRNGLHKQQLFAALSDPEPEVRAAAVVALGTADGPGIAAFVDGSPAEQLAIVRAIGRVPPEPFRTVLDQLIAGRDPAVVREVLRVWERSPALADVDTLIGLLDEPHVRGEVRGVLSAGGVEHLPRLVAALRDPATPLGVRRHLPRTISRFGSPAATAALVAQLAVETDGTTEFKILRALGRLRADRPTLAIDPQPVSAYLARTIDEASRYASLSRRLAAALDGQTTTASGCLLVELLAEKQRQAIERAFRALGILHPGLDLRGVYDAIASTDDDRRAAAREIVEGILPVDQRIELLAVIDGRTVDPAREYGLGDVIAALLEDPSDSLRCVAAYHVAERQLVALRSELRRLRPRTGAPLVVRAFDQALEVLDA
jgi:hypothetical protein